MTVLARDPAAHRTLLTGSGRLAEFRVQNESRCPLLMLMTHQSCGLFAGSV